MSKETVEYYARKCFPHLLPRYAILSIEAILISHNIPFEPH